MSQSGFTPIQLYRSSTAAAVPTAGNLVAGELAINTTDEKLYFENASGVVKLLASSAFVGTVTSVAASGGTTGLTFSGSPITSSGTFTLAGTLAVANGGTGVTSSTGTVAVVLSNTPTLVTPILGAATATSVANGLGAVGTPSYTFTGDLNTGMWSPAADTIAFSEGGAEAMRITSAGFVGIGTTAPGYKLDVSATGNISGQFKTSGSINALFLADAGTTAESLYVGTVGNDFRVVTGSNDRMRITAAGDVGIGTSAPGAKLEVSSTSAGATAEVLRLSNPGSGANTAAQIKFFAAGTGYATITGGYGAAAPQMTFNLPAGAGNYVWQQASTESMRIDSAGNVGIGTTSTSGKLTVAVAPSGTFQFAVATSNATDSDLFVRIKTGISDIYNSAGTTTFSTGALPGTERMCITAAGNVGIGTTAPTSRLTITSGQFTSPALNITGGGPNQGWLRLGNNADIKGGDDLLGLTFTVGASERMRIDSAGNLLVGTTSNPDSRRLRVYGVAEFDGDGAGLTVYKSSGTKIGSSGQGNYVVASGPSDGFGIQSQTALVFGSGGANERARIDSTGNLLVGCTTTGFAGGINTGIYLTNNTGGSGGLHVINNSNNTAANVATFYGYNGTQTGSISTFVNTTNYNVSSDARLKENIADADDAASLIDAIKVRKFDWKSDNSHQRYGMVAQELVTVVPEAVSQQAHPDDLMGVDYSKLVPMLIKALQELTARVAQLEGK